MTMIILLRELIFVIRFVIYNTTAGSDVSGCSRSDLRRYIQGGKEEWYLLFGSGQGGEKMLSQAVERGVIEEEGDPECLV